MISRDTEQYREAAHRVKISHFTEQGLDIKGIIHIGAHDGEEVQYYQTLGIENILCFEPLPFIIPVFKANYPDVPIHELALGSKNRFMQFNVTNDGRQGQASSIFEPLLEQYAMTGGVKEVIKVQMMRFDTFVERNKIDLSLYDCVVIDVQGAELDVLQGFGELLTEFKYFNIECSEQPTYEGGAAAQDVVDFLKPQGIIQDSPIVSHDDVFFVRSDIKPTSDMIYRGLA